MADADSNAKISMRYRAMVSACSARWIPSTTNRRKRACAPEDPTPMPMECVNSMCHPQYLARRANSIPNSSTSVNYVLQAASTANPQMYVCSVQAQASILRTALPVAEMASRSSLKLAMMAMAWIMTVAQIAVRLNLTLSAMEGSPPPASECHLSPQLLRIATAEMEY